jgi:hypothetical protein
MSRPPESIFPTFFLSGFECSTFDWHGHGRRDLLQETLHREHAREDYRLLADHGIGVARESVPWPFVDHGGAYDFSAVDPVIAAMNEARVAPIWDLCHYGTRTTRTRTRPTSSSASRATAGRPPST